MVVVVERGGQLGSSSDRIKEESPVEQNRFSERLAEMARRGSEDGGMERKGHREKQLDHETRVSDLARGSRAVHLNQLLDGIWVSDFASLLTSVPQKSSQTLRPEWAHQDGSHQTLRLKETGRWSSACIIYLHSVQCGCVLAMYDRRWFCCSWKTSIADLSCAHKRGPMSDISQHTKANVPSGSRQTSLCIWDDDDHSCVDLNQGPRRWTATELKDNTQFLFPRLLPLWYFSHSLIKVLASPFIYRVPAQVN